MSVRLEDGQFVIKLSPLRDAFVTSVGENVQQHERATGVAVEEILPIGGRDERRCDDV
jgi:hypothetical protein